MRRRNRLSALLLFISASCWAAHTTPHRVLILGDSLTEGYGVAKQDSYPSVLSRDLKKEGYAHVEIINAGIGGSTTASGLTRLKWDMKAKPDILILALGANDGLRGLKPAETEKNLLAITDFALKHGLKVLIAGMKAPPNYGPKFTKEFENTFREVARKEKVRMIPFLLQGVAGEPSLNQTDGIHPNEKGHRRVALTVKKYLEPML